MRGRITEVILGYSGHYIDPDVDIPDTHGRIALPGPIVKVDHSCSAGHHINPRLLCLCVLRSVFVPEQPSTNTTNRVRITTRVRKRLELDCRNSNRTRVRKRLELDCRNSNRA